MAGNSCGETVRLAAKTVGKMLFARILISPLRTRAVTGGSYLRRMAIEEYGYQRMVEVTKGNIRQGDFWVSAVLPCCNSRRIQEAVLMPPRNERSGDRWFCGP